MECVISVTIKPDPCDALSSEIRRLFLLRDMLPEMEMAKPNKNRICLPYSFVCLCLMKLNNLILIVSHFDICIKFDESINGFFMGNDGQLEM